MDVKQLKVLVMNENVSLSVLIVRMLENLVNKKAGKQI